MVIYICLPLYIFMHLSICQLDKIWLRYEAIKFCDLYMVINVYYCIYLYISSGWSFLFFMILLHLSICQLDKNWDMRQWSIFGLLSFICLYICTPSEWHFFLILMHPNACHLDENWLRYKIQCFAYETAQANSQKLICLYL